MEFSTVIQGFNQDFNTNAISDYNKYLKGQASFEIDKTTSEFQEKLESAEKSFPLRDKKDATGMGNFMDSIASSLGGGINAVNAAKIEANRMQEDIAMGGSTSIHDAMIAAEKAELSMQMAVQVRNKILNAYTEITTMTL